MTDQPTIIDVAKKAGVSKTTVWRVINGNFDVVREDTRQVVLNTIEELGYQRNAIASSLRKKRTETIMLVIPDIANPFWPEVAKGVQETLDLKGYAVVLANSDWLYDREKLYLSRTRSNRFDGLIFHPTCLKNNDFLKMYIPLVVFGHEQEYRQFDTVSSDTYTGILSALEYLYQLGHRCIGMMGFLRKPHQERYRAYVDFHQSHGLPVNEDILIECPYGEEYGLLSTRKFLELPQRVTAVLAGNDIMAIGALQAAQEAGIRVPEDLSIVGMDNIFASSATSPTLTTISKDKYGLGSQAANFLLDRILATDPIEPRHVLLPCKLVERGSTAPCKTKHS